jgi:hypothetical protein
MDGVLCDLVAGLRVIHGFDERNWPPGQYNIATAFSLGKDFWHGADGPDWWARLPKMPDADEIFAFACGISMDVTVLTHAPSDAGYKDLPSCVVGKVRWLREHYPNLPASVTTQRKDFFASRGHLLIDDADSNVRPFRIAGGAALLVPRVWNSEHANRHRVMDHLRESWRQMRRESNGA